MGFETKLALILIIVPCTFWFLNVMAEKGAGNKKMTKAIIWAAYLVGILVGTIIYAL